MYKCVLVASAVVLAMGSAGCARDEAGSTAVGSSLVAPSAVSDSATPTLSAKGGGKPAGGNSSLTLAMVTDNNANGLPNRGDSVTFNVYTTATSEPHVDLTCYQNGVVVYGATTGYYAGYPWPWTQVMTLSSNAWQSGAADCSATLYYFNGRKNPVLATLRFTANE